MMTDWSQGEIVRKLLDISKTLLRLEEKFDAQQRDFISRSEWEMRKTHVDILVSNNVKLLDNKIDSISKRLKDIEDRRPSVIAIAALVVSSIAPIGLIVNWIAN